jgi:hypothetical protein
MVFLLKFSYARRCAPQGIRDLIWPAVKTNSRVRNRCLAGTPASPKTRGKFEAEVSQGAGHETKQSSIRAPSNRPGTEAPHEPVGIPSLRLALDGESLAADGELIVRARACDLARLQLEGRGLGVDAGLAEADDRVRTRAMTRTDTGSPLAGV